MKATEFTPATVCRSCLGDILKGESLVRDRKGNPLHAWCKGDE